GLSAALSQPPLHRHSPSRGLRKRSRIGPTALGGHRSVSVAQASSSGIKSLGLPRSKHLDRRFTVMIYEIWRQPLWPSFPYTGMSKAKVTALNAIARSGMGGSAPWSNSIEVPWGWSPPL